MIVLNTESFILLLDNISFCGDVQLEKRFVDKTTTVYDVFGIPVQ